MIIWSQDEQISFYPVPILSIKLAFYEPHRFGYEVKNKKIENLMLIFHLVVKIRREFFQCFLIGVLLTEVIQKLLELYGAYFSLVHLLSMYYFQLWKRTLPKTYQLIMLFSKSVYKFQQGLTHKNQGTISLCSFISKFYVRSILVLGFLTFFCP